ncbi:MAG: extradiol ring-cleavage dioxygenase, partial [Gammaproteobacteria bacterium]
MSLVFAGICSHGPGMTGRAHLVQNTERRDEFFAKMSTLRDELQASGAEALVVVAAEHFANFFMNNMPAFCIGIADHYEGPIEDPAWLRIPRRQIPGNSDLSGRLVREVMQSVDTAYAEEWKFDHGIMVPLNFLT